MKATIGHLWWKADWLSPCSKHRYPQNGCRLCEAGHYSNRLKLRIDQFIYRHWPNFWRWKHNPHHRQKGTLKLRPLKSAQAAQPPQPEAEHER